MREVLGSVFYFGVELRRSDWFLFQNGLVGSQWLWRRWLWLLLSRLCVRSALVVSGASSLLGSNHLLSQLGVHYELRHLRLIRIFILFLTLLGNFGRWELRLSLGEGGVIDCVLLLAFGILNEHDDVLGSTSNLQYLLGLEHRLVDCKRLELVGVLPVSKNVVLTHAPRVELVLVCHKGIGVVSSSSH